MERINFPYRSETHLPFLHVVGQSGSWEKHGQDKAAEQTDPMALWDFHFLRRIDDSGFIDGLYRGL